jgi:hypothetical protein
MVRVMPCTLLLVTLRTLLVAQCTLLLEMLCTLLVARCTLLVARCTLLLEMLHILLVPVLLCTHLHQATPPPLLRTRAPMTARVAVATLRNLPLVRSLLCCLQHNLIVMCLNYMTDLYITELDRKRVRCVCIAAYAPGAPSYGVGPPPNMQYGAGMCVCKTRFHWLCNLTLFVVNNATT